MVFFSPAVLLGGIEKGHVRSLGAKSTRSLGAKTLTGMPIFLERLFQRAW